jgi:chlorophyllide a reductase subunit Y
MGPAGAGSLAQIVNAAIGNAARFDRMKAFFAGVGTDHASGVWEDVPRDRPEFREAWRRKAEKAASQSKVEEPV